jgi:hypothetical protein
MATTHVDRHNERFALEALELMAEAIRSGYLPFTYNHDPRRPPMGRAVDAEITPLADGEHALEAAVELFEAGPAPELDQTGRRIPVRDVPDGSLLLSIDRTFTRPEFTDAISEIAELFDSSPRFEGKKALEPIAVLTITVGAYAVGRFASSFFSKLGANAADALSARLKQLVARRQPEDEERLLLVEFAFDHERERAVAQVILSGPSEEEIDRFLQNGIHQLDELLPRCVGTAEGVVRYVFRYSEGRATLSFAVRRDAVPLFPTREGDD